MKVESGMRGAGKAPKHKGPDKMEGRHCMPTSLVREDGEPRYVTRRFLDLSLLSVSAVKKTAKIMSSGSIGIRYRSGASS